MPPTIRGHGRAIELTTLGGHRSIGAVRALSVAWLLVLAAAGPALAQSPLAAEARALSTRYHEDLPRLDRLYTELAETLKTDAHLDNLLAYAQICFIWGDVRAGTP